MNQLIPRVLLILLSVFFLNACVAPKTPQDVTKAFWDAVLLNDARDVARYSTLSDPQKFDGFSKDWNGYQPSWGTVVIEGNKASIESEFFSPASSGRENRQFTTYLVRINEEWKVDYERTEMDVRGGAFGSLFEKLSQMSDDLSQQLQYSTSEFNAEMERLGAELEAQSNQLSRQASETLDRYAVELHKTIDELVDSINRALEDGKKSLSEEDRRVLTEVSDELEAGSEELSDPSVQSVVDSSASVGHAQVRLQAIDDESFAEYQQEWQRLTEQFRQDVEQLLAELTGSSNAY